MDIIYLKAPPPAPPLPAVAPTAPVNKVARNGGGGAKKRAGGFTMRGSAAACGASLGPMEAVWAHLF